MFELGGAVGSDGRHEAVARALDDVPQPRRLPLNLHDAAGGAQPYARRLGATAARNARVRSADALIASRPSPSGTMRALRSVSPASAKWRRRFSMVASLPQIRTSPMVEASPCSMRAT